MINLYLFSPTQASDLRVAAMGQLWLVLNDDDNQINLYDFGRNPAWLIIDQQQTWLRPGFIITDSRGDFKRFYDPQRRHDILATFEGVKIMDPQQAFRGAANYHDYTLEQVTGAINRNPYEEHPFRLVDSSIADIHYWGPAVSAQYSRQAIQKKLFLGALLNYSIETGLKDQFPQPRTIYRSAGSGAGIAYRWSNRLVVGATLNYTHTQEFIECLPPSANETRTIYIKQFRNENLSVDHVGSLEQFLTTQVSGFGLQGYFQPLDFWESGFAFNYQRQRLDVAESLTQPQKNGLWKLFGLELHWKNRFQFPALPIRCALSVDYNEIADCASNPANTVIWGDDWLRENRIGVGLAYEPEKRPLILGIEYYHSQADKSKKDYGRDPIIARGQIERNELRMGAELKVLESVKLRMGYLTAYQRIDRTLLQFSEVLSGHRSHQFHGGLAYTFHAAEVEGYAYFGNQRPNASQQGKHDTFGLMLTMTFYQN